MKPLQQLLDKNRRIRVIGFDDAPFGPEPGSPVSIAGVVCAGTVFEGMLWGTVKKDGNDATDVLACMLRDSKFYEQIHLVLIDGLAVGGFNLIDLPELAGRLDRPCAAFMRRSPDMKAVKGALRCFDDHPHRIRILQKAGPVHPASAGFFQVAGESPPVVAEVLARISCRGSVPEALRIAHLIGTAVIHGQSGNRA